MHTEKISYSDGQTTFLGHIFYDETQTGKKPLVLVAHDWSGCNDFARDKAAKLAQLGYVGFAIDMFGDGKTAETNEEKSVLIRPLVENRNLLKDRMLAALNTAKKINTVDSNKMGAIGFCFGGLCALDLARTGEAVSGVVSFHGLLGPNGLKPQIIKAKILALHGYDDPMVPPDAVNAFANEMTQAKADWQIHMYGHTKHAFTNPKANDPGFGTVYEVKADNRSWIAMKNFFAEAFA